MNVPSGYTALDMVGFTDKGAYNSATSYVKNDLVRYNGDTWRCKLDDTVNHTPEEGTYWTIFIDAPSALDDLTDVTISSVANGDVLEYDSATSKWKNSTGLSDVKQALSDYVADYGVKNLLENTSSLLDANGVHFVVNSDGTVTVSTESGGATINTPLNIATGITINKPVRLSGCPSGGSLNSYWLDTGVTTYADIGSGVSVNSLSNAIIRLVVKAGTVITTPIVFKPMITDANVPNSDYNHYVPYAKSNTELTKDDNGLTANAFTNGAVNLLPNEATSQVIDGVTFTVNADGTISTSGTSTAAITFEIALNLQNILPLNKALKISGCPSGGGYNDYFLTAGGNIDGAYTAFNEYGSGENIILSGSSIGNIKVSIIVRSGKNMTGKVFKPMITVADMPNSDYNHYVTYAKSNKELTDAIEAHSIGTRVDISSYTSANYYPTSDGYLFLYNDTGKDGQIIIGDSLNVSIGGVVGRFALYVRKGTTVRVTGTPTLATFAPLS